MVFKVGHKINLGRRQTEDTKKKLAEISKGNKYALGQKLSEETRKKMSEAHMGNKSNLGRKLSEEHRQKIIKNFLGRKHTEETKQKMSKAHRGIKNWLGKHHTEETKRKISQSNSGVNNWNWKGGITPFRTKTWKSKQYQVWRNKVFLRDNYTCQMCSARSGKDKAVILNSHHIKSFSEYPERRFWVSNGITLCKDCHKKTDNYCKNVKKIEQIKLNFKEVI